MAICKSIYPLWLNCQILQPLRIFAVNYLIGVPHRNEAGAIRLYFFMEISLIHNASISYYKIYTEN